MPHRLTEEGHATYRIRVEVAMRVLYPLLNRLELGRADAMLVGTAAGYEDAGTQYTAQDVNADEMHLWVIGMTLFDAHHAEMAGMLYAQEYADHLIDALVNEARFRFAAGYVQGVVRRLAERGLKRTKAPEAGE